MWLLNNLSSFVLNAIIVKHNTSAIGKTCPSVMLYCILKYLRECQFFKEIVIFQKSDPLFVLFQTAITLLISTLHWKAMLYWKCLYICLRIGKKFSGAHGPLMCGHAVVPRKIPCGLSRQIIPFHMVDRWDPSTWEASTLCVGKLWLLTSAAGLLHSSRKWRGSCSDRNTGFHLHLKLMWRTVQLLPQIF